MPHLSELAPTFGLLAGVVAVACNVPYLRDTCARSTVPHRGSWLIWSVLEVVAVGAQGADGARWSLVPLVVQAAVPAWCSPCRSGSVRAGSAASTSVFSCSPPWASSGWMAVDGP